MYGSRRSPGLRDGEAFLAYLSRLPILCDGTGQWLPVKDPIRLQWRDRAGFTPDFPIKPVMGTEAIGV